MSILWPVEIAGTGTGLPKTVVTNEDWTRRLETTDEWIVQRTGVKQRRFAAENESTLDFSTAASRLAIDRAGITPAEIDLIIHATITPEHPLPSTACELQHALGCRQVPAFDLVAACSGFVYSLITASQYIQSGMARNVLIVGSDCMSRMMDPQDRGSAILLGDGAGAAVIRAASRPNQGVLAARMGSDGARSSLIWVPAGGAREPASLRTVNERLHFMRMKGRDVYKFAVTQMQELLQQTLEDAGMRVSDLSMVVPHQSNLRIIESVVEKLQLPPEKCYINIERYGNTSAASVPIALHECWQEGRIQRGDVVMLVAFGAGLTWGSVLLRI